MLLDLITTSHLPFLFVEHQKFRNLFSYARLAPTSDSRLFPAKSALERAIKGDSLQRSTIPQYDELTKYLQSAISDTEEDIEMHLDIPAVPSLSEVAAGKRPAVTFEDEEDSNADEFANLQGNSASPLPDLQHRVSGRMRKRSRLLDGYIV
ncbi:hypothetical protein N7526_001826 [Penicillium atrosanguineum]|nr:hypothetical protein N7526_001826 [Penicillium atrosanguineum]